MKRRPYRLHFRTDWLEGYIWKVEVGVKVQEGYLSFERRPARAGMLENKRLKLPVGDPEPLHLARVTQSTMVFQPLPVSL